jgi:hypothetical protein
MIHIDPSNGCLLPVNIFLRQATANCVPSIPGKKRGRISRRSRQRRIVSATNPAPWSDFSSSGGRCSRNNHCRARIAVSAAASRTGGRASTQPLARVPACGWRQCRTWIARRWPQWPFAIRGGVAHGRRVLPERAHVARTARKSQRFARYLTHNRSSRQEEPTGIAHDHLASRGAGSDF